jgi:hypothetical protein
MGGRTCATNVVEVGAGELLSHTFEIFSLSKVTVRLLFEHGMILSMTDREELDDGNLNELVCCFNCPRCFCLSCLNMREV